jgi:predicted transcriptional regulator
LIEKLPPRERELFERLYNSGEATASELQDSLEGNLSNSAVRVMLRRLEAKGFVTHREEGGKFIYSPAMPESRIRQSALQRFVETFFNGSPLGAATALLGMSDKVSPAEIEKLEAMLAKVRKEQGQ